MRGALLSCAMACVIASAAASPVSAQGKKDTTVVKADSVRLRILERLRRLAQPPGADSIRLARASAALAERTRPGRPTGQTASSGDSIMDALLRLPGYSFIEYEGTALHFRSKDRRLNLRGSKERRAQLLQAGIRLTADSAIVYEELGRLVRALGESVYTPEAGEEVTSGSLVLSLDEERGSAMDARTRYDQGSADWIVHGDLPAIGSETVHGVHARFTSCDADTWHYYFEAGEVKIEQARTLVARPVTLYFHGVPVLWLPFIAQGLDRDRSSGLLTPRFSVNDIVRNSRGYSRRISNVGFYWALSEYADATVALDWFSGQFTSLTGSFRYRWLNQFLDGRANFRQYWRAEGGSELAFDTQHRWDASERTRLSLSARYASSTDFVRRNSFNPRELTQSINSEGGIAHRFDWGSLSVGANRQQYLSDDRVEETLPNASLSLNPLTFKNITWNGSVSFNRRSSDRPDQLVDSTFSLGLADRVTQGARLSSSFSLGGLSWSQSLDYSALTTLGVPDPGLAGDSTGSTRRDLGQGDISWSTGLGYQQRLSLLGSTTVTPSLQLSGSFFRSDAVPAAEDFVAAPSRFSLGANLRTDIYGMFGGFGPFSAIRHKISPSFSYEYAPAVTPTPLQEEVFGSRVLQTRSVLSLNLNQTFEAKIVDDGGRGANHRKRRRRARRPPPRPWRRSRWTKKLDLAA